MSVFKNILLIFILFLYSCTSNDQELTTNSQNEGSTNINLSQNKDMTKTEEASLTVQMVPDWCTEMPISKSSIYACGIGNSSNPRAIIDGKSKLASQINNEITSRMTDLLEDLGNYDEQVKQASERVIKSVSRETQIAGYQEVKSEFQNIGDKFQTYVLLEYPIDQANQLLFEQIKQDSILSNQEAIDSALEELEAEIKKKN